MPTLESLILESGAMTPAQIAVVKEEQRLRGGTLDANILALGYLTEPALQRLMYSLWPHPAGVRYDRDPSPEAVRLLTREQAASLRAVPQAVAGKQLTVLVNDEATCEALAGLEALADYDLVCVAVNEVRLCHYLEAHYQMECSARYREIMARIAPRPQRAPEAEAFIGDPMAGLEPDYLAGAVLLRPAEGTAGAAPAGEELDPDVIPLLEEELLIEVEEDDEEIAEAHDADGQQALQEAHEELATDDFQAALDNVTSMDAIPDVFFRFGVRHFKSVALFKVQSQMIMGWKGAGLGMVSELIRGLVVPLQSDTFLARGIHEGPYVGPAASNPVEERIAEQLGANADAHVTTAAVSVGDRPVLVVCGVTEEAPPAPEVAAELGQLCSLASATVLRLILERKKAKQANSGSGTTSDPKTADGTAQPAGADAEPVEAPENASDSAPPKSKSTASKRGKKKSTRKKKADD